MMRLTESIFLKEEFANSATNNYSLGVLGSDPANSGIDMSYAPLLLLLMTFNFWVSHWEKYNTGILYLPWMFDIAQTVSSALFFCAVRANR